MPPVDPVELKGRKLGRVLTKLGVVTREQVHEALSIQKTRKVPIGKLMVELGYCTDRDVSAALAGQAGMAYIDLTNMELPDAVRESVPAENVHAYQVVPIEYNPTSKRLKIAMKSPDNFRAVDDLRLLMGFNVDAVVADEGAINALIKKYYSKQESVVDVVQSLAQDKKFEGLVNRGESIDLDAVMEAASDNQVVKLLNLVLLQAIRDRASDIHFEPFETEFKMRYRIDGVLYEMVPPPKHLGPAITSRIKVMANLDIAERRLPQDGRIELTVGGNPVDLRIAVLPTMWGESVVMRVLDRSNVELSIDRIGMREQDLNEFRALIRKPNGIVIVTGPTGSGKTTTLYSALDVLNRPDKKIITAEDPVEYNFVGINQCQVREKIGLTFSAILRSMLRQAPNIILVGEIRDKEVAEIAIQAALTGHLVFSTLHTNDAPSAMTRLIDMGVKPFLVASSIQAIMAQRLIRILCKECKVPDPDPDPKYLHLTGITRAEAEGRVHKAVGCPSCAGTGYRGRKAIFEMLQLNSEIRELAFKRAPISDLRRAALATGMRPLVGDGKLKILRGDTTPAEVAAHSQVDTGARK